MSQGHWNADQQKNRKSKLSKFTNFILLIG